MMQPRIFARLFQATEDLSCPGGGVHEWTGRQTIGANGWFLCVATKCGKCHAIRAETIDAT